MSVWPIQEAKARFSELLRASIREGPQVVTYHGKPAVVMVPVEEWERLQRQRQPTLKTLLLAASPVADLAVPARGSLRRRPVKAR